MLWNQLQMYNYNAPWFSSVHSTSTLVPDHYIYFFAVHWCVTFIGINESNELSIQFQRIIESEDIYRSFTVIFDHWQAVSRTQTFLFWELFCSLNGWNTACWRLKVIIKLHCRFCRYVDLNWLKSDSFDTLVSVHWHYSPRMAWLTVQMLILDEFN